jgi:hypothetical protein
MKSIDLVGIMKTVASVSPLEGENEFLVKYGNHKQVVIVVKEAAQPGVQRTAKKRGKKAEEKGEWVRLADSVFPNRRR